MAIVLKDLRCKECPEWLKEKKKAGRVNLGTKEKPNFIHVGDCMHPAVVGEFSPTKDTLVFGPLRTHSNFGCIMPRGKLRR